MTSALSPQPLSYLSPDLHVDESVAPPLASRSTTEPPLGSADGSITSRQCGRCRAVFPGDPTLDQFALPEWWLCPPCRLALLGQEPRGPGTSARSAMGAHRAR
jgi:hypothetical protein